MSVSRSRLRLTFIYGRCGMEQVTSVIGATVFPMLLSLALMSLSFALLRMFTKRGLVRAVGAAVIALSWFAWAFHTVAV